MLEEGFSLQTGDTICRGQIAKIILNLKEFSDTQLSEIFDILNIDKASYSKFLNSEQSIADKFIKFDKAEDSIKKAFSFCDQNDLSNLQKQISVTKTFYTDSIFRSFNLVTWVVPNTIIKNNKIWKPTRTGIYSYDYETKTTNFYQFKYTNNSHVEVDDEYVFYYGEDDNLYKFNYISGETVVINSELNFDQCYIFNYNDDLLVAGNIKDIVPYFNYGMFILDKNGSVLYTENDPLLKPFYRNAAEKGHSILAYNNNVYFSASNYGTANTQNGIFYFKDIDDYECILNIYDSVKPYELAAIDDNWLYFHGNTESQSYPDPYLQFVNRINLSTNEIETIYKEGENPDYILFQVEAIIDNTLYGIFAKASDFKQYSTYNGYFKIYFNECMYKYNINTKEITELNNVGKYTVTATPYLNIREEPNTDSSVIGSLNYGEKIDVFVITDGWGEIFYAGESAWVSMDYLTIQ